LQASGATRRVRLTAEKARAPLDRPVNVVDAVNTVSPMLWHEHVDHLNRPIRMTNGVKA
jgi:hypothetical protein